MPESAADLHARITAAAGPDGRLPSPPVAEGEAFPWDAVDGAIVPRVLRTPEPEQPRKGEDGGEPCPMCAGLPGAMTVWEDEHWVLTTLEERTGLPLVLTLWTREHKDIGTFGDEEAGGLGRISNRLVRIMEGMPGIGRVHVHRWGDGCSHAHVWFYARPADLPDVRGVYAVSWDAILPPPPEDVWRADLHTVATKLSNWGGTARA